MIIYRACIFQPAFSCPNCPSCPQVVFGWPRGYLQMLSYHFQLLATWFIHERLYMPGNTGVSTISSLGSLQENFAPRTPINFNCLNLRYRFVHIIVLEYVNITKKIKECKQPIPIREPHNQPKIKSRVAILCFSLFSPYFALHCSCFNQALIAKIIIPALRVPLARPKTTQNSC